MSDRHFVPHMVLLAIIGGIIAAGILLFVIEVVCVLRQAPHRPSTVLRTAAKLGYDGLHWLGHLLGIFFDLFGFVRRLLLKLRELFFKWIPKEVILQAHADLKQSYGDVLAVPAGFFRGLWASIMAATVPLVSGALAVVVLGVVPLLWEVIGLVRGWTWRPIALLLGLGFRVFDFFYSLGEFVASLAHLKQLAAWILELVLGYVPKEQIIEVRVFLGRSLNGGGRPGAGSGRRCCTWAGRPRRAPGPACDRRCRGCRTCPSCRRSSRRSCGSWRSPSWPWPWSGAACGARGPSSRPRSLMNPRRPKKWMLPRPCAAAVLACFACDARAL